MRTLVWAIACAGAVLSAPIAHAQATQAPTVFGGATSTALTRALECAAASDSQSYPRSKSQAGPSAGCPPDRRTGTSVTLSAGRTPGLLSESGVRSANILMLSERLSAFSYSQDDVATSTASFGPTWRLKSGIGYAIAGGVELTASAIVRRGYSLPIAMVQPIGSDVQTADGGNAAIEFGSAPVNWDTELRIRKMLTSGRVDLSVVGEAFNLFGPGTATNASPGGTALRSPTFRAGTLLEF